MAKKVHMIRRCLCCLKHECHEFDCHLCNRPFCPSTSPGYGKIEPLDDNPWNQGPGDGDGWMACQECMKIVNDLKVNERMVSAKTARDEAISEWNSIIIGIHQEARKACEHRQVTDEWVRSFSARQNMEKGRLNKIMIAEKETLP